MKRGAFTWVAAWLAPAALLAAAPCADAEAWVVISGQTGQDMVEVDVDSAARSGDVARLWTQMIYAQPKTDHATGKPYSTRVQELRMDCRSRRVQSGAAFLRNASGAPVAQSAGAPTQAGADPSWVDPSPGSVMEAIWTIGCRLTEPQPDKPYLADIFQGQWTRVAASADGRFVFDIRADSGERLDRDDVMFMARTDDPTGEDIGGVPVAYVVSVYLLNCADHQAALVGADSYITGKVRIAEIRHKPDALEPRAIPPGSLLARAAPQVCASAVAPPADAAGGGAQAATAPDASEPMPIGAGTAWATSKGYLVTASHVVQGGDLYFVYRDGQVIGQAKLVADDPASDLAILKLKSRRPGVLTALPLAARGAPLGESVFSLGYPEPQELGQEVKLTTGVVSGTNPDDARMLQVTSPLQPGNSGGPIIGWDGAVVGVADKAQTRFENAPAQNVNYAVKTAYVRAMLEDLPDLGGYAYVKPAASHEALIEEARRAVFMLIVAK